MRGKEIVAQMAKLMVSIREESFRQLVLEARERGITIQELIRAVIVPDWVRASNGLRNARTFRDSPENNGQMEFSQVLVQPRLEKVARVPAQRSV